MLPCWPFCIVAVFALGGLVGLLALLAGEHVMWPLPLGGASNVVSVHVQGVADNGVTVTTSLLDPMSVKTSLQVDRSDVPADVAEAEGVAIPPDFDYQAYIKWNPELRSAEITDEESAKAHYLAYGHAQHLVYKDYNLTIRYTACGGCMNQHYSHIAALTLAHMSHAQRVVWPAMQERRSFNNRYHPDAKKNMQSWQYLDATSLWDIEKIQKNFAEKFGIEVIKHPDDPPLPDMTKPEIAFQTHSMASMPHNAQLRFTKRIYIARHEPHVLARSVMDAGRQVLIRHGRHPTTLLVDLPCTLFMIDNRNLTIVEEIAKAIEFSPYIKGLADKVIQGIKAESDAEHFNGIHLRMEKDAADWASIIGGAAKYWDLYKASMVQAGLTQHPAPLYVASGLLKASKEDTWSKQEMDRLTADMVKNKFTNMVVYKERYLAPADLQLVSNEQSGLIDFLVMLKSKKLVGIGVSTFSFFLAELRMMEQNDPAATNLMMLSFIGTDELFFSCGIVAIRTRAHLALQHRLPDLCRRPTGKACFVP